MTCVGRNVIIEQSFGGPKITKGEFALQVRYFLCYDRNKSSWGPVFFLFFLSSLSFLFFTRLSKRLLCLTLA